MAAQLLDIPYSLSPRRDPLREFDLYLPPTSHSVLPPLICFVHGGAWRSEDKKEHALFARRLADFTCFPVAVPNYRLSVADETGEIAIRHPAHAEDILQFLTTLSTWQGPSGLEHAYNPDKLFLMGHSCSAHMLSSIFLDSSSVSPSLTPPASLLKAVKAIVMSEGIYDIDLLLSRFPDYRDWFITAAFGNHPSFPQFSITNLPLRDADINWLVIHSKGDTLVDVTQSEAVYKHLYNLYGAKGHVRVTSNMTELDGEHDEILLSNQFVRIVGTFLMNVADS